VSSVILSLEQCRRAFLEAAQVDAMSQTSVSAWPTTEGGVRVVSPNHREIVVSRTDRTMAVDSVVNKIREALKR